MESGQPSRAVSSWFYGDGALLLNETLTQFSNITGTNLPRLAPLDSALFRSGAARGNGGLVGLRVSRQVTDKVAIDFSVERGLASLELTDELNDALQDAVASFKTAFEGLLATAPTGTVTVTSQLTMAGASSGTTRITGAARWTMFGSGRLQGYLTGGGGVTINGGEGPSAILNGRYRFTYFNLFPMDETDRVVISVEQPKNTFTGLAGGGVTYDLSSSTGLRADVRLLLNSTKDVTRLTSAPLVALGTPPNVMSSVTSPGLQFSTTANIRSSLSGANQNITLFTASGFSKQVSVSLGFFKRF